MKKAVWILLIVMGIACFAGGWALPKAEYAGAAGGEKSKPEERSKDQDLHQEALDRTLGWQRAWSAKTFREGLKTFLLFSGAGIAGFAALALAFPIPNHSFRRSTLCIAALSWILAGVYFTGTAAYEVLSPRKMEMAFENPRYAPFFKKVKETIPEGAKVLILVENPRRFHAAITRRWPAFFYQAGYILYPRRLYFDRSYPTKAGFAWKRLGELGIEWILLITDEKKFECIKVSDLSGPPGRRIRDNQEK